MSSLDLLSRQWPAFARRGADGTSGDRAAARRAATRRTGARREPKGDLRLGVLAALACWALLLAPLLFFI